MGFDLGIHSREVRSQARSGSVVPGRDGRAHWQAQLPVLGASASGGGPLGGALERISSREDVRAHVVVSTRR